MIYDAPQALVRKFFALVLFAGVAGPALAQSPAQPYAGQQGRDIKALSAEDIAALRNGEGMGLAKAAELNFYPGPAHVLAMARELKLTDAQRRQVQAIFDHMQASAVALGAEIIERERALDRQFAEGTITADRLAAETAKIAALRRRLRAAHLTAHLETRPLPRRGADRSLSPAARLWRRAFAGSSRSSRLTGSRALLNRENKESTFGSG